VQPARPIAVTELDVALIGSFAALAAAIATLSTWVIARLASSSSRDERIHASRLETYDEALTLAYQVQAQAVSALAHLEGMPLVAALGSSIGSLSVSCPSAGRRGRCRS
jgi:hypothetical protein